MDLGTTQPLDEVLGLSPVREAARLHGSSVPPGFSSRSGPTDRLVSRGDLREERYHVRDKEKRRYARLPRLEDSAKTYAEVELFITAIEGKPNARACG